MAFAWLKNIQIRHANRDIPLCISSFEHALNYIVDEVLDLSVFEGRFCNDETGAPAYDSRIMLKIITLGLDRFTLRGRLKVGVQWKLYSMVHTILKIYRYGSSYAY
jgi:hypothetical protein